MAWSCWGDNFPAPGMSRSMRYFGIGVFLSAEGLLVQKTLGRHAECCAGGRYWQAMLPRSRTIPSRPASPGLRLAGRERRQFRAGETIKMYPMLARIHKFHCKNPAPDVEFARR